MIGISEITPFCVLFDHQVTLDGHFYYLAVYWKQKSKTRGGQIDDNYRKNDC